MSSLNLNNDGYSLSLDLKISLPSQHPSSSSSTPLQGHVGNIDLEKSKVPFGISSHVANTVSAKSKIPFGISNPSVIQPNVSMVQNNEGNFRNSKPSKAHWKASEDAKLKQLIADDGAKNWNNIAKHLHGRSGKSCRLRWLNQLDPSIKREPLSKDEEEMLLQLHTLHGNKWAHICKHFPGRTDNALKNQFHVIKARRQRELLSSIARMEKLTYEIPAKFSITSPIDESNLNLTRTLPSSQMGLLEERMVEVEFAKTCSAMREFNNVCQMEKLKIADQSNHSDSNSEGSSSESAATNMNSGSILGDSENVDDKIKMPFFDFLGVGDT